MNELEYKTAYAAELLKYQDPFKAANALFNGDAATALYVSQNWANDEYVLSEKERLLKEKGSKCFLPSKEDFAKQVMEKAAGTRDPDSYAKLARLFADTMGYIEKVESKSVSNTQINNKVMVIQSPTSNPEDWEKMAMSQQNKLVTDAEQ